MRKTSNVQFYIQAEKLMLLFDDNNKEEMADIIRDGILDTLWPRLTSNDHKYLRSRGTRKNGRWIKDSGLPRWRKDMDGNLHYGEWTIINCGFMGRDGCSYGGKYRRKVLRDTLLTGYSYTKLRVLKAQVEARWNRDHKEK